MWEEKTIDNFCSWFQCGLDHDCFIDTPHERVAPLVAENFCSFFGLSCPIVTEEITTILAKSNIKLEPLDNQISKSRGWNCSFNNKYSIYWNPKEPFCGQIHTILHELYEIIMSKINLYSKIEPRLLTSKFYEAEADFFSANVYMQTEALKDWIIDNGFDIFGIIDNFYCSYTTAILRANSVLCQEINKDALEDGNDPLSVITVLYERPYWKQKTNKTPNLSQKCFTKSQGFPFSMSRSDIGKEEIMSSSARYTVDEMASFFRGRGKIPAKEVLLKGLYMRDEPVDILIRTKKYRKHNYTAKVLLQIGYPHNGHLTYLAHKLGIKTQRL